MIMLLLALYLSKVAAHCDVPGSHVICSRKLFSLRTSVKWDVPAELYISHSLDKVLSHRATGRRRGRRGGVRRRLKRLSLGNRRGVPPLPTILFSRMQSIRIKVDNLEAWAKLKETCLLAFTETWLSETDQDKDLAISGFGSPFRLDWSPEIKGKSRGGCVCLFVNQNCCINIVVQAYLKSNFCPSYSVLTTCP